MLYYPVSLDVPVQLVIKVSNLLRRHREELGTRNGIRALNCWQAIPESTRSSITLRLLDHAREHWPKLEKLQVKTRSGFAYVTAALPGEEPQPLFRLRYGGSARSFGFALYSHAAGRYEDSLLTTGSPVGTPQEAPTPPASSTTRTVQTTNPVPNPRRTYGANH